MPVLKEPSLENQSPKAHINFLKSELLINPSLDHLSNYQILGVTQDTSIEDIGKRRQKLFHLTHPDKTVGNKDVFNAITNAYNSLAGKSIIPSDAHAEDQEESGGAEELLASVGASDLFSVDVDDEEIKNLDTRLVLREAPQEDPNKKYENRGKDLINTNYVPYISPEKFLKLIYKKQKELAILLAKKEEAYFIDLKTHSNNTDFDEKTYRNTEVYIRKAIDLDSPHIKTAEKEIIRLCNTTFHQLGFALLNNCKSSSVAAITDLSSEIADKDPSELYLMGRSLICE